MDTKYFSAAKFILTELRLVCKNSIKLTSIVNPCMKKDLPKGHHHTDLSDSPFVVV